MINTPPSDNAYAAATRARKGAIASEFYSQFSELVQGRGGLSLLRTMFDTLKNLLGEYEHDFIAQLIFPDHYPPARYPIHFPIPTVVFETVDYGFVRPNNSGNMSIVIYPKRLGAWPSWADAMNVQSTVTNNVIHGPVLSTFGQSNQGAPTAALDNLARLVSPAVELYNEDNWAPDNWGKWKGIFPPDDINLLYQSLRMTGCCFRMQYMSRLDEVSGYLCSAVDYKHNADIGNKMVQIDYGLYKRTTHPLEGVRVVWFPKDILDEEFEDYSSWAGIIVDDSVKETWGNPGTTLTTNEWPFCENAAPPNTDYPFNYYTNTTTGMAGIWNSGDSVYKIGNPVLANSQSGKTLDGTSRQDNDCLMMYATGLPHDANGGNQFRVELIRHWEAIPLQKFRQYLYGERPFTSQRGYDAMKTMGNMFPFFGTVTNMEAAGLKDVVGSRLGELNPGQINASIANGGSNDIITSVAQALG